MVKRSKRVKLYTENDISLFNKENMDKLKKYLINLGMRELSQKIIYGCEKDIFIWFGYILKYQDNKKLEDIIEDDAMEYLHYFT